MSVFLDDDLELRPGWRFATYALIYVGLFVSSSALMSVLIPGPIVYGGIRGLTLNALTFFLPAVLSFVFMLRFVERRKASEFGVGFHEKWERDLIVGLIVAGGMLGIYAIGAQILADWTSTRTAGGTAWGSVLLTVGLLAVSAANEELVFRGYPLQVLIPAVGRTPAVLIMAAIFGLGHHMNPNASWLGTLNVVLAGILLSVAYLRTRTLWLPYGIHIGWNLLIGVILGLPVSGVRISTIWTTSTGGERWLTGGPFGPEGGILATIAIIAAAVFVHRTGLVEDRSGLHSTGTAIHQEVH